MEFYEDRRQSQDLEEDPHSSKFRAEGQLMNYEEDPSFEGYLQVKARLSGWGGRGVRGTAHEL